jgi:hypothetical protein
VRLRHLIVRKIHGKPAPKLTKYFERDYPSAAGAAGPVRSAPSAPLRKQNKSTLKQNKSPLNLRL